MDNAVTLAALTKVKNIRVWDVGEGGCLIECRESLPVGTTGLLTIEVDGRSYCEWFRVCRVHSEGSRTRYLVGAEFLVLAPPGRESLRAAIRRMRPGAAWRGIPSLAGRSSGDPGRSAERRRSRRWPEAAESKVLVQIGGDPALSTSTHELAAALLDSPPRARQKCVSSEKE